MNEKILFSWSGGKDSALALYEILRASRYEISALLTTVTEEYDRISMHGVRRTLLEQQAASIGLPLEKIFITKNATNDEYEAKMRAKLLEFQKRGIASVVFGDIFLEDLRNYREENLAKIEMKGIFPIWKRDTAELANTFMDLGFKAFITCIDSKVLDKSFVGRPYDKQFLADLPSSIDPCGENGEFHSFVYDGPIFQEKIALTSGEVVFRDNRFYFSDFIPANGTAGRPDETKKEDAIR